MSEKLILLICFKSLLLSSYCLANEIQSGLDTEVNLLLSSPNRNSSADHDDCYPLPDPSVTHYIVGYGSLIDTVSKERTYRDTGENIPVLVHGYCREWSLKGDALGPATTYLGVFPDPSCSFNGVTFQLPSTRVNETIYKYDAREHHYCRQKVDTKDIRILSQNVSNLEGVEGNQYWIYVNKPEYRDYPSENYPIVQSYVDTFISGCLEIEDKFKIKDFAKACVDSTRGWSSDYWINDRIFPRRPYVHQPKAEQIDFILNAQIPKEFANIKLF